MRTNTGERSRWMPKRSSPGRRRSCRRSTSGFLVLTRPGFIPPVKPKAHSPSRPPPRERLRWRTVGPIAPAEGNRANSVASKRNSSPPSCTVE
jgi:hypothetical protein